MINKFKTILFAIIGILGMASCSESDDSYNEYSDWQSRNDAYFMSCMDSVGTNGWVKHKVFARKNGTTGEATDYILMKKLSGTAPDDAASPMLRDSVQVHYRGNLMPASTYVDEVNRKNGYQFDSSWFGDYDLTRMVPARMAVVSTVEGFSTALQYMHLGDRYLVVIPYQQGYGTAAQGSIPACSVLRFDITLVGFSRPGSKLPSL